VYIHCNFCLNPSIIHGNMKENVSWVGVFFWTQCSAYCVYSLQFLFKSINNSWKYERKCELSGCFFLNTV